MGASGEAGIVEQILAACSQRAGQRNEQRGLVV